MSEPETQLAESAYISRVLTHIATRSIVSGNVLFQLSITLARIALETIDADYELQLARAMYACLANRPQSSAKVIDLAACRAAREAEMMLS